MITTREEYEYCLSRGYDPLIDERFPMDINLRREIQREKFGKNNAEGNRKFYRYIIEKKEPICENCLKPVYYPSAINCSHILSRGSFQEGSHDPRNISFLCAECHNLYEHSTTRHKLRDGYVKMVDGIAERLKKEYRGLA